MGAPSSSQSAVVPARRRAVLPGVAIAVSVGLAAVVVTTLGGVGQPVVLAIISGVALGNLGRIRLTWEPGLQVASRTLLRAGIVVLGLRVTLVDVSSVGWEVSAVIVVAMLGVLAAGVGLSILLGLRPSTGLLAGTGFAICGATAVAATQAVIDADEDEVAIALGSVLAFGTLSMLTLPLIAVATGLDPAVAGMWMGSSINDVGQSVAAAGALGEAALQSAVVVKLGRVALLGPLLIAVSLAVRRVRRNSATTTRPPLVPAFIVGFLVCMGVASTGLLPEVVTQLTGHLEAILLATALFALGTEVRWQRMARMGIRPLVLGGTLWLGLVVVTFVGLRVATGT